jgi:hypothetical protein
MNLFKTTIKLKGLVKTTSVLIFAVGLLLVAPVAAHAQPPSFDDESPTVVTDAPAPIDDWVFVLVAAGIIYGLLRGKEYRRKDRNKNTVLHS